MDFKLLNAKKMKKIFLPSILFIYCLTTVHAQSGLLDPTFGTDGIVKTDMGSHFNYTNFGKQVLMQSDGSIYLVFEGAGVSLIEKKLANGSPDLSYGNNGFSVSAPIYDSHAVMQTDGKVVVAGYTVNPDYYSNQTDFALARFNTDGSLDNTFDGDGIQVTDLNYRDVVNSVAIQSDGKIIVGGSSISPFPSGSQYIALARYNIDGSLDNSFDGDGIVTTNFGGHEHANSVCIQHDGKIVVGGMVGLDLNSNSDPALVRYNDDGTLDLSFNGIGYQVVNFGTGGVVNSIAVQSNGKIVAAGYTLAGSNYNFALARFNPDGSPDISFDGDGLQTTDFGGNNDQATSIAIQLNGKLILAGATAGINTNFAIARYNINGSLDNTYSGDGKKVTDFGSANDFINSIAIQSDGKLVALGYTTHGSITHVAAARYTRRGRLDNSFDGNGKLTDHVRQGDTHYTGTAVQSDGKIVAAGYTWNGSNYDFALARYNTDGSLDNTFSGNGKKITDFGSGDDKARAIAIQSDGKIILAGSADDNFGLVRYNTDGTLDHSFDGDGIVTTDFGSSDSATSVIIQSDGKIVAGGSALARYNTNGSLDLSFDGDGKLTTPFDASHPFSCKAIALQNDGKIVTAGNSNGDGIFARYNSDGSADNSFGINGVQFIYILTQGEVWQGRSIGIQNDGKIVVGGDHGYYYRNARSSFALLRLNTDGSFDATFGDDGMVFTSPGSADLDYGTSVLIQSDNKIILAGYSYNGSSDDFAIARYNTDGSLDNTFSGDGIEITQASTAYDRIAGIALDDDKLYAAGDGQYPGNFGVVAKYLLASGGPLPVTFIGFTAELKNKSVLLQWQTENERNLSRFIIERSADGNTFSSVANVAAAGNSSTKINYTILDQLPLPGVNFYRLKMIDTDGKFKYSKVVAININNKLSTVKIFPNPAGNILYVQASGENERATFQIMDATGRKLQQGKITLNRNTSFSIYINNLPKGIYNLQLFTKSKNETLSFIKE